MGIASGCARKPPKRSEIKGWSAAATNRNTAFLRSVREDSLEGFGFAATLTLRRCPAKPEDWQRLRNAFFQRLRREKLIRCHWVVEWQRRRVPHLHLAIWSEVSDYADVLLAHWIEVAKPYKATLKAQTCIPIHNSLGWFQYVAKHAARGANHYQRHASARPKNWETSGRIWGKFGHWVTDNAQHFELSPAAYFQYRRILKRWVVAQHRQQGSRKSATWVKRSRKCNDKAQSACRVVPKPYSGQLMQA